METLLTVSLGATLLLSALSLAQMDRLGSDASSDSSAALERSGQDQLLIVAKDQAEMCDEKLSQLCGYASMLRSAAENIYQHPELYAPAVPRRPDAANAGTVTVHQFFDASYVETEEAVEETALLANLQDMLEQFGRIDPAVSEGSIYIATESGVIFMADKESNKHTGDFRYDDIRERPWYVRAKESGELGWTDVFIDGSGRGSGIVCSAPVYDRDGKLKAVVGVGAILIDLEAVVNEKIGETGYTFIVNDKGSVILSTQEGELAVSPLVGQIDGKNIQARLTASRNAALRDIVTRMTHGGTGVTTTTVDGRGVYLACAPIETLGWSVGTVIDTQEILAPSVALRGRIGETVRDALLLIAGVALLTLALGVVTSGVLSGRLTASLRYLSQKVSAIGGGSLHYEQDLHTGDEVEMLSETFAQMTAALRTYIDDLTAVTAEKERIGAELDVACNIQASMLPRVFPPFPDRTEFDVYATMDPAKEVGGDFYDFFLVDAGHLALVMADVSGKGVPAALFMMIAKTLLKSAVQSGLSPKAALEKVNGQLCEHNDAEMFVTVWLGVLDISTGELVCANAGHEYPAIRRRDGAFELFKDKHGLVLAGMEGARYREYELELHHGDTLYVYTDGVPEATDAKNELFGTDRMLAALNSCPDGSCKELLEAVRTGIDAFVGDAPQFDDITMLCLRMNEHEVFRSVPDEASTAAAASFVERFLDRVGAPVRTAMKFQVASDEIWSNIVRYSGAKEASIVAAVTGGRIALTFTDDGMPYDPLARPDPDTTLPAEEREIGGLGIFITKKTMDETSYRYVEGRNVFTIYKDIKA